MKTTPMIFTGESVRGILDGSKTMTRRVVQFDPRFGVEAGWVRIKQGGIAGKWDSVVTIHHHDAWAACSYGLPGDRLWVREAHRLDPPHDGTWDYYGYTDGVLENISVIPDRFRSPEHVIYRASWDGSDLRWRPSIFMPRWASRITLEITGVRVERLNEIRSDDCIAEGILPIGVEHSPDMPRREFQQRWDQINGKKHPWDSNPWVWVIEFTKIDQTP